VRLFHAALFHCVLISVEMPRRWIPLSLWLSLVAPSLYVVQKYTGWIGAVVYVTAAAIAVRLRTSIPVPRATSTVRWAAAATAALVVAAFVAVYPVVNTHVPGTGSDDDDTYNIGARALVAGRSPYDEVTYLGNALHPLPGSFILAAPFVLLGTSAWQNIFWLTVFFLAVNWVTASERDALRLAWLVLAFSPTVIHQIVTGTGHAANTIYVLLGLLWLIRTRHRAVAAIAWGIALASRANFLFVIPLAFGWIANRHGWRAAARATVLTCLTIATLTLPFYFHDPDRFGPAEGANRVLRFDALVPYSGEVIVGVMGLVSIVLAARQTTEATLFANGAIVQAVPIVVGSIISGWQRRQPDLAYAAYATFAAWFVIMAIALSDER
jgi:hypothetical protein